MLSRPLPILSLGGAVVFAVTLIVMTTLDRMDTSGSSVDAHGNRLLIVMFCVLFAFWSSIVSLITAWCPIILGGDRRPWLWVIPQVVAWFFFVQIFDWTSLVPHAR